MLKKAQLKNATRGGSEAQGAKLVGIILEYGIGIITCGFGPQDRGFESLYSNKNKYVNYFIGERGGLQIRCPGMGCTGSTPVLRAFFIIYVVVSIICCTFVSNKHKTNNYYENIL